MAKVSVIVPVYNVEKYLSRCLDSIVSQSFEEIEIICVNDGSTDNSPKILEAYKNFDPRIKIVNKQNGGLSSARNAGLEVCSGEYILFVDSDDLLSTNAIERLCEVADKKEADVVAFPYIQGTSDINIGQMIAHPIYKNESVFSAETATEEIYKNTLGSTWCKMYKASLIKGKIKFLEQLFEDIPFWAEVFVSAKRITYLLEPLYFYRLNRQGQIMNFDDERVLDIIKSFDNAELIFKNAGYWEKYRHAVQMIMMLEFKAKFNKVRADLKEKVYNAFKALHIGVDWDYYKSHELKPYEKLAVLWFEMLNSLTFEEYCQKLKEAGNA